MWSDLYWLLVVCLLTGSRGRQTDQPRHSSPAGLPAVGQPPLSSRQVEVLEAAGLVSDLVARLHWPPEAAVGLYDRGGRPQGLGGLRTSEVPPGARVSAADGEAASRRGVSRPGAQRQVEVLSAGPLVPVVGIFKSPASQRDRGGRHCISLQSGQCWARLQFTIKTPRESLTDN